jgi:hypothetical protein
MKNVIQEKLTHLNTHKSLFAKMVGCLLVAGSLSGCAGSPASEGKGIWGVFVPKTQKTIKADGNDSQMSKEGMEREDQFNTDSPLSLERNVSDHQRIIFSQKPWG